MMKKKILLILGVLIIICGMGVIYYKITTRVQNEYPILEAKTTMNDFTATSFVNIYNNGEVKAASFKNKKFEKAVSVDPDIFVDHTNKDNSISNTINIKMLNKNKELNSDSKYIEIINYIARYSNHMIFVLNIFKVNNQYYVFLKYNAGVSDDGTLYKFNSRLTKICTLDSKVIVGLRKAG
ncbi:hypothetical protein [Lactobacillus sp. PV037]|uniref:hypothetical protein n=1 Tax=Lactobacillus sp. PV037 TaxID=2594496 RepID=UPI003A101C1E